MYFPHLGDIMKFLKLAKHSMRFRITTKITWYFLMLLLISLLLVGFIFNHSMLEVSRIAVDNINNLKKNASATSANELMAIGKKMMLDKASEIAQRANEYLISHPNLNGNQLSQDQSLAQITVQHFGNTGYTYMYEETQLNVIDTGIIRSNSNPDLINHRIKDFSADNFSWDSMDLFDNNLSGYYTWKETSEENVMRFMCVIPVSSSPYMVTEYNSEYGNHGRLLIAATMDVDELLAPSQGIQRDIAWTGSITQNTLEIQRQDMERLFTFGFIVIIIVASILVFLLAKTITRPILAITENSKTIAEGNFEQRLHINTHDELEDLANQFNRMASALRESYSSLEQKIMERTKSERKRSEQLRTINDVGRKLISILSIDRLMPVVVNSLCESFHYYNAKIYIYEPDSNNIALKASARPDEIVLPENKLRQDESLGQRAFRSGESEMIKDYCQETSCLSDSIEIKSAIAVPIKMGEDILGVIEVQSRNPDLFDETDQYTIQALADQIAVAIVNAHLYLESKALSVLEERNRLAREIHDTLAQGFTGIVLQLEAAEQTLHDNVNQSQEHLDRARTLARESLNEARRSVWALRPSVLEQYTFQESLGQSIDNFNKNTCIKVNLHIQGEKNNLHPDIELAMMRICNEALTNIERYAKATRVAINLIFRENTLELNIQDNGIGFDTKTLKTHSFGLIGMRERTQLLGGTLKIQSEKGQGTLVTVSIPYQRD
jgi:nitrate/nitrite-specific signal transduction histidine kinase